jgi:hypothetical protein
VSDLIPTEGNDPKCKHPEMTRTHLQGHGRNATYEWHCPDCDYREVEGWEGDE